MLVVKDSQDVKKNEAISILKIGYSKDDRGEGRFQDYISSGQVIQPVKTISGGSLRLEGELQKKYGHLSIPGRSKEWFYMSDEILDDFSKCNSETDLYRLLGVGNEDELIKKLVYEDSFDLNNKSLTLKIQALITRFKLDHPDKLDSDTYRLLEEFENLSAFSDRMRLICSNSEDSLFLQYIPEPFITYFSVLGPKRCSAVGYIKYKLTAEYNRFYSNRQIDLSTEIYNRFELGEKYSLFDIKKFLIDLYNRLGYKSTAKATDLLRYFDLKLIKMSILDNNSGSKKIVKGYLILGKKNN